MRNLNDTPNFLTFLPFTLIKCYEKRTLLTRSGRMSILDTASGITKNSPTSVARERKVIPDAIAYHVDVLKSTSKASLPGEKPTSQPSLPPPCGTRKLEEKGRNKLAIMIQTKAGINIDRMSPVSKSDAITPLTYTP